MILLTASLRKAVCAVMFAWMGLVSSSVFAAASDVVVGEVIFAIGDARLTDATGTHAVRKGDKVHVGQTLASGDSGHIHVRFIDKAFVSIRPHSTLRVDTYAYDAEKPAASFVKFTLDTGTARLITGAAGHAAKENFRLNTPVAAIGVRGTDFVVHTTAETTRVSVNEGAIAMSPLSGDCRADGFGPCQNDLARQLTSATANAYLELRSRSAAPVLQTTEVETPNRVAPPRPEEPRPSVPDKSSKSGGTSTEAANEMVAATLQRVITPSSAPVAPPVVAPPEVRPPVAPTPPVASIPETPPTPPVVETPPVVVAPPPPPPPAKVWWGRWADYVGPGGAGSVQSMAAADRELAAVSPVFGMYREKTNSDLVPNSGVVGFTLADYEAYRREGKTLLPATISNATLTMDFGKRTFDTNLTWSQGGQSIALLASGSVSWQGYLASDPGRSNTDISGAITNSAAQVGYLFYKSIDATASAVGVTRWIH